MKELLLSADVTGVVTWAGTLVSLWGLFLSWRVYKNVSAIKKDFVLSARLPGIISGLEAIKDELISAMGQEEVSRPSTLLTAEVCIAKLESLQDKLDGNTKGQLLPKLSRTRVAIDGYKGEPQAESLQAWYVAIGGLITSLQELVADRNWEKAV